MREGKRKNDVRERNGVSGGWKTTNHEKAISLKEWLKIQLSLLGSLDIQWMDCLPDMMQKDNPDIYKNSKNPENSHLTTAKVKKKTRISANYSTTLVLREKEVQHSVRSSKMFSKVAVYRESECVCVCVFSYCIWFLYENKLCIFSIPQTIYDPCGKTPTSSGIKLLLFFVHYCWEKKQTNFKSNWTLNSQKLKSKTLNFLFALHFMIMCMHR